MADESRALREELGSGLQRYAMQTDQRAESLRTAVTSQMDSIRTAMDQKLASMQADNAAKLEQMRLTVDEKLQSTLETRLGESFRLVSERLEQVHKGLGEMQNLAAGVGDLKRVLGNVTTRGAWGEVQLENLLTQMLAPGQFERNVSPKIALAPSAAARHSRFDSKAAPIPCRCQPSPSESPNSNRSELTSIA